MSYQPTDDGFSSLTSEVTICQPDYENVKSAVTDA